MKYEYCWLCDQPTGRAGILEDSIYTYDGDGPYCEECWEDRRENLESRGIYED